MAQPTKSGNAERGWNDPPVFLHTPVVTGLPPNGSSSLKRTPLNKRVAHPGLYRNAQPVGEGPPSVAPPSNASTVGPPPISQGLTPTVPSDGRPPSIILLPPTTTAELPQFTAPIIVPCMSPTEKTCSIIGSPVATNPVTNMPVNAADSTADIELAMPNFDNDQQLYHYVVTRLHKTLRDCHVTLQAHEVEDCGRRLGTLAVMWDQGKLSYPVKSAMARLATALHRRKCDLAHQIHLALMFDHISEVSQWMVGVKRLIGAALGLEPPVCPTDYTAQDMALQKQQQQQQAGDTSQSQQGDAPVGTATDVVAENATTQGTANEQHGAKQEEEQTLASDEQTPVSDEQTPASNEQSPATLSVDTEQVMVVSSMKTDQESSVICDHQQSMN